MDSREYYFQKEPEIGDILIQYGHPDNILYRVLGWSSGDVRRFDTVFYLLKGDRQYKYSLYLDSSWTLYNPEYEQHYKRWESLKSVI
jgi:hypothetical protein